MLVWSQYTYLTISPTLGIRKILKFHVTILLSAEFPHSQHVGPKKVILDTVLKMQWPWYHCNFDNFFALDAREIGDLAVLYSVGMGVVCSSKILGSLSGLFRNAVETNSIAA